MQAEFTAHIKQMGLFNSQVSVLVAVSTGADSMALLNLLAQLPSALRPRLNVVHVNHQLRQASVKEAAFLTTYCQQHDWPLFQTKWPLAAHPQHGTEVAARQFRYQYFARVLQQQGISYLVTAHHADDQLETMLMRLARGGNLQQLTAIAPVRQFHSGQLVRPLLPFTRQQLRRYVATKKIPFFEDQTNQDVRITRNRIRHEVVPVLKALNPLAAQHAVNYAVQLQRVLAVNDSQLDHALTQIGTFTAIGYQGDLTLWHQLSSDKQRLVLERLLTRVLVEKGVAVKAQQITAVLQLLNSQRAQSQLDLAAGWQARKTYQKFTIGPALAPPQPVKYTLSSGTTCQVQQWQISLAPAAMAMKPGEQLDVWLAPEELPLQIRHRQPGDRLKIRAGHQKVKRILSDQKIPQQQRDQLWVIATQQNLVLWLLGLKKSQLFKPQQTDKIHYRLTIKKT